MHISVSAAFSVMVPIWYRYAKIQTLYGYFDSDPITGATLPAVWKLAQCCLEPKQGQSSTLAGVLVDNLIPNSVH